MAIEVARTPDGTDWPLRLGRWSIGITIAALAIAAVGLAMAWYDVIPKLAGFSALLGGGLIGLLGFLLDLVVLIAGRRRFVSGRGKVLIASAVSLLYVGFLASRPLVAVKAPAIHDITADLANPPQLVVLALRGDDPVGVGTADNWRRIHVAYGDLGPATIARSVPAETADAVRLVQEAGWQVVRSDPAR